MRGGPAISLVRFLLVLLTANCMPLPSSSCLPDLLHTSLWARLMIRSYVINLESNMDFSSVIKVDDDGFQGLQ